MGQEPWNTLWDKWEECIKVHPEPWGQKDPMYVAKYWEQFIQNPGRAGSGCSTGGALLSTFKITVGLLQAEQERNQQLQEQLQAIWADQLAQRQALFGTEKTKEQLEEKCINWLKNVLYEQWGAERGNEAKAIGVHQSELLSRDQIGIPKHGMVTFGVLMQTQALMMETQNKQVCPQMMKGKSQADPVKERGTWLC